MTAVPIYEYQCDNCDYKLECIQKIDEDPLLTCPRCETDSLRKLVSAASFRLKGTGWYATDFKDKSKSPPADKAAAGVSKPETKPAADAPSDKKEASGSD